VLFRSDFVSGIQSMLQGDGIVTLEFPHLMCQNQFYTIYHEHFSYFSFIAVENIFGAHGLTLIDVERLPHMADPNKSHWTSAMAQNGLRWN